MSGGPAGKPAVLFLCTANSARSVMAEAFLRREAEGRFEVASAGLEPRTIHPLTVRVMGEVGLDVSRHEPQGVREFLGRRSFRYVVTVCQAAEAACPAIWPFAPVHLSWPFPDPAAATGTEVDQLARFRQVRDDIERRVRGWLSNLSWAERERGD